MNRDDDIFAGALDLPVSERAAFVAQACAGDHMLRVRVEALLALDEEAQGFLESPLTARRVATAEEKPGDVIGRYKLRQKIGPGASALRHPG